MMLDGFIRNGLLSNTKIFCNIPRDTIHQQFRFPEIQFIDRNARKETASNCGIWLGVGDTPVQVKSGEWFLVKLERDAQLQDRLKNSWFMVGIGVEKEAVSLKKRYSEVLRRVEKIWTRDEVSREILINEFGYNSDSVFASADLANISLERFFRENVNENERKYDLGLCYYDEEIDPVAISSLRSFLKALKTQKKTIIFFANDVNANGMFEKNLYKIITTQYMRLIKGGIKLHTPNYFSQKSLEQLCSHFRNYDTVMTSRYHALLAASWAGCKVVSLQRSSKVSALAKELGITEVKKPYLVSELTDAFISAKPVGKDKLAELSSKAKESILQIQTILGISETDNRLLPGDND